MSLLLRERKAHLAVYQILPAKKINQKFNYDLITEPECGTNRGFSIMSCLIDINNFICQEENEYERNEKWSEYQKAWIPKNKTNTANKD